MMTQIRVLKPNQLKIFSKPKNSSPPTCGFVAQLVERSASI